MSFSHLDDFKPFVRPVVKVVCDTISPFTGKRLTTLQCDYQRFFHSEVMTHRMFSRSASSSRAIPVHVQADRIKLNPATPMKFGLNEPGMQANKNAEGETLESAMCLWFDAAENAYHSAQSMRDLGLHKQIANRIVEPFQVINVVITATEWENFFELRDHPDALPEIQALAQEIKKAMDESEPVVRAYHLPYLREDEMAQVENGNPMDILEYWAPISAARCARASYNNHDGTKSTAEEDFGLYENLVGSEPLHASPTEHQGFIISTVSTLPKHLKNGVWIDQINLPYQSKNFNGFTQFREYVETKKYGPAMVSVGSASLTAAYDILGSFLEVHKEIHG